MGWPWDEAKKAFRKIIEDPAKRLRGEIERGFRKVGGEIEGRVKWIGRQVEDGVKKVGNEVESGIKTVGHEVEDSVKKVAHEAEDGLKKAAHEIEETFEERLPDLVEDALENVLNELARAVTKEGLKAIRSIVHAADRDLTKLKEDKPGLVGAIDNLGFSMEIGPITLAYSGFYTRIDDIAEVLDRYVNEPPEFRREPIIQMIGALGPDTVDLGASVQVMALVVGSKELGIGGSLDTISIELFEEIADAILEELGVPA